MSGSDDNDEPWDCDFGCGFADRDFNIVGLHEQTCRLRDNAQPIGTNQAEPETAVRVIGDQKHSPLRALYSYMCNM